MTAAVIMAVGELDRDGKQQDRQPAAEGRRQNRGDQPLERFFRRGDRVDLVLADGAADEIGARIADGDDQDQEKKVIGAQFFQFQQKIQGDVKVRPP